VICRAASPHLTSRLHFHGLLLHGADRDGACRRGMAEGRKHWLKGDTHNGDSISVWCSRSQQVWWFEGGTEMEPTSGDLRFTSHRLSDICLASEKGGRHTSSVNKPTWRWRNLGIASQPGCHFISSSSTSLQPWTSLHCHPDRYSTELEYRRIVSWAKRYRLPGY
jgi:hypothetical protein